MRGCRFLAVPVTLAARDATLTRRDASTSPVHLSVAISWQRQLAPCMKPPFDQVGCTWLVEAGSRVLV
jgi:hypothetical protein